MFENQLLLSAANFILVLINLVPCNPPMPLPTVIKAFVRYCCWLSICLIAIDASVYAQLRADFTVSKQGGCAPLVVSFNNTTTGASANAIWKWDLGNGNTSAARHPGAIYSTEKVYTITLTVEDGSQTSTKTQQVTVYSKPTVDFTVAPTTQCRPTPVQFTSSATPGSGTINNYFWDFGDGNTQQGYGNTISHSYNTEQQYSVSLTVTNSNGCYNTVRKNNVVKILRPLTAGFTANKTFLCRITESVQFTNSSNGPGTLSYLWDFGDGTTSSALNPSHVFARKGIHTISLTVRSSEGCISTSTQPALINVATFNTEFDGPAKACVGENVQFNSRSSPTPISALWEVNGQAVSNYYFNYNRNFSATGTYAIKLTNTFANGCSESITKQVVVKGLPVVNGFVATSNNVCGAPATVSFKDTTAGAVAWHWDFDYFDHYYDLSGTSQVQAPSFGYPREGYPNILLTVTNADGCRASTVKQFQIVKPSVGANVSGADGFVSCGPLTVTYSVNTSETITNYRWTFGDGTTSSQATQEHTFNAPGYYQANLQYTTSKGCVGTAYTRPVQVNKKPVVTITASTTEVCGGADIVFSATPYDGTINFYSWDFGDGVIQNFHSSVANVTHSYAEAGTYTIKLKVKNDKCDTVYTQKIDFIKVKSPHVALPSHSNTCDGTRGEVSFIQASKNATTVTWDFGDNSTVTVPGTQTQIKHTYTRTGTYAVKLTAVNGNCVLSTGSTVYVYLKQQPRLVNNTPQVCTDIPLNYTISNFEKHPYPYDPWYTSYFSFSKFEYEDLTVFNGWRDYAMNTNGRPFTSTLGYPDKTKKEIRAIYTSTYFGCQDTTNFVTFKVREAANPDFTIVKDGGCYNSDPVELKDNSSSPNGTILTREWYFGDGQYSNQSGTVKHTYDAPGTYYVSLRVTDNSGCPSPNAAQRQVIVKGAKASFGVSSSNIVRTGTINFYNYTSEYYATNVVYRWDFGDGNTSTQRDPSYQYNVPGTYVVKLRATDQATGCTSEATPVTIVVGDFAPAFNFSVNSITGQNCAPILVQFNNISLNYTRVVWDFGDGYQLDNVSYPGHVYDKPGKYTITLYVYGPHGLTGTYKRDVEIGLSNVSMVADIKEGCIGHTPTLTASGDPASAYTWDMGDGNVKLTTTPTTAHSYSTPGVYTPLVLANSGNGCLATGRSTDKITIRPNPAITIAPAEPVVCLGASTKLKAAGGKIYSWSPPEGLSATNVAEPLASPATTTTYLVEGKDEFGCKNTQQVTVKVIRPTTVLLDAKVALCAGAAIPLKASGAERYFWIFNTTGLSNTTIPNPSAKPPTSMVYTVRGTDAYSCFSDTAEIEVTVNPLPTVNAGPDVEVLPGTPVQLSPTYSNDVIRWNWMPTQYLDCIVCPAPLSKPMSETLYTLTVWNRHECFVTDSLLIKMICKEDRVGIPNAFTPNNDGVNDLWAIKGISVVKSLIVFNRWGQKVFERKNFIAADRHSAWDGNFNGYPAPPGTFVYFVEMECPSGGKFSKRGTVILTR